MKTIMTGQSVNGSRQRRRRKDARPAEIVDAGVEEFIAHGFAAARIEDVARRAGVAKGTVFLYFPTKEALFEAALSARATPMIDRMIAQLETAEGTSLGLILGLIRRFYVELARPEVASFMHIIIAEGPRFPAILESWHRISIQRMQAALGGIVERGVSGGELRPGAITELPMVLGGPLIMAAVWRMTFDVLQPIPLERFRDAHIDLVTRAFTGPASVDNQG